MSKDYINQLKQQLTVELQPFIGMPNNKKTQHQMLQTIQDLINRFNTEGYNITVNPELMSELNDIRLTFSDYERNTAEENN
jgi:hypothetical protein